MSDETDVPNGAELGEEFKEIFGGYVVAVVRLEKSCRRRDGDRVSDAAGIIP